MSGFEGHTTNNRMELTGPICALKKLNTPCRVELYSDSAYLSLIHISGGDRFAGHGDQDGFLRKCPGRA